MTKPADDQKQRNEEIVAALRAQFQPLAERLSPDVEPAPVYTPERHESD